MDTFDASTGRPVGEQPTNSSPPANSPGPTVDLTPVRLGSDTFANPCFWILVGVVGTVAAQWFFGGRRSRKDEN